MITDDFITDLHMVCFAILKITDSQLAFYCMTLSTRMFSNADNCFIE